MRTKIDINGLGTFHAAFTALSQARLTGYSTGNKLAYLTIANKPQNNQSFSAYLLPSVKTQEIRIEENNLVVRKNIQYDHYSEINGLSNFYAALPYLSHTYLNVYSTGEK